LDCLEVKKTEKIVSKISRWLIL